MRRASMVLGAVVLLAGCVSIDAPPLADDVDGAATSDGSDDEAADGTEDPEPVDLRDVDWASLAWSTDCVPYDAPATDPLTLSPDPDAPGVLLHRTSPPDAYDGDRIYSVEVDGILFGDVDGRDGDEAILTAHCFEGANHLRQRYEVWTVGDDGQPRQLPTLGDWDRSSGFPFDAEVVDGAVRVHTEEGAPGDEQPWLTGYPLTVVTDWWLDDDSWAATEVSREGDTTPDAPTASGDSFVTPSGNIACLLLGGDLRCEIGSGLDPAPGPEHGTCDLDWTGAVLPPSGAAVPLCAGDTILGMVDEGAVLAYGRTWGSGPFTCTSQETGLTCDNDAGGGFHLSRRAWSVE